MKLSERLDAIIAERHLLKHPFYQAWTEGKLSLDTLRRYAGQYHRQVSSFPRFVSSVHSRCPEISARKVLTENLADEEIHGTDHPELWLQFAEGLGAKRDDVQAEAPLPETTQMVDDFFAIAASSWTEGLCALYAYESQVPAVSTSKIDGLEKHYGVTDAKTLAFFKVHQHYDVEHARKVSELIDLHADPATAEAATQKAADALWGFLDGMAREAGITCSH
ncbi:MAG: CADD family putative folate metabolism protein [Archangiaceae bacterium]|nr:CADD family putative folate metabolism protein [Archangiaceae bacterium]